MPRYRNFWSKDPFLGNPGVQRVFSLKHYSKLSEYLHVSDHEAENNRGHPDYDRLGKICWFYQHLLDTFRKFKNPERVQVINEQLMPFSGQVSYIQYHVSMTLTLVMTLTFCVTNLSNYYDFTVYSFPWNPLYHCLKWVLHITCDLGYVLDNHDY